MQDKDYELGNDTANSFYELGVFVGEWLSNGSRYYEGVLFINRIRTSHAEDFSTDPNNDITKLMLLRGYKNNYIAPNN